MSIIFGIANLDHMPIEDAALPVLAQQTAAYALDGTFVYTNGSVGMGFQPHHTTMRSRLEVQPWRDAHGNILVFDGRLDNYEELAHRLSSVSDRMTDPSLILAAFEKWKESCFEQFIGDWSLALWYAEQKKLYLARDHAGTRTLYYQLCATRVVWSTYLETFLGSDETTPIDDEFAARYLGGLPIRTSTPYPGVRALPPAHMLVFGERTVRSTAHWSSMSGKKLLYKDAREYDDQFIECFERSVRRRDISGARILAELSGGMDSTAIVCVSDALRKRRNENSSLLDTVSLYDDSETDWNELPYIAATEKYRGKLGFHIPTSYSSRTFSLFEQQKPAPFPGFDSMAQQREDEFEAYVAEGGYRVIFSGIGGDELLGGVPTPYPELADHFASLKFQTLLRQGTAWCLSNREAFLPTLLRTIRFAFDLYLRPMFDRKALPPWISPSIQRFCHDLALEDDKQHPRIGHSSGSISNNQNWLLMLETLPHLYPKSRIRREYRYPYLDRDLVDYLLQIPRQQLVQPGRRRAMMRRALKSVMPEAVVERRRKAHMSRGPLALLQKERPNVERLLSSSRLAEHGYVDISTLLPILQACTCGADTSQSMALLRFIALEFWLQARDRDILLDLTQSEEQSLHSLNEEATNLPMARTGSRLAL